MNYVTNKFVLLFRGINVSGHKMIKMNELRENLGSIGLKNVVTYIQSGNVIFESEFSDLQIKSLIKSTISHKYNFEVEFFLCNIDVIKSALDKLPFYGNNYNHKFIYIGFIIKEYNQEYYTNLLNIDFSPEEFQIIDNILYFYIPNGQQQSKFSNNFFENKLNTTITTRNLNTCQKLIEIYNKI